MIVNYPIIHEAEEFHGFRTVHFYEIECEKAGQHVKRIPCFAADGTALIALLTVCPTGSPASFDSLDIITADEAHCLYSGAVRHSGADLEAVLKSKGYYLSAEPAPAPASPVLLSATADDSADFVQFSLFA